MKDFSRFHRLKMTHEIKDTILRLFTGFKPLKNLQAESRPTSKPNAAQKLRSDIISRSCHTLKLADNTLLHQFLVTKSTLRLYWRLSQVVTRDPSRIETTGTPSQNTQINIGMGVYEIVLFAEICHATCCIRAATCFRQHCSSIVCAEPVCKRCEGGIDIVGGAFEELAGAIVIEVFVDVEDLCYAWLVL